MTRPWAYLHDEPEPLPKGLDAWVHDGIGVWKRRRLVREGLARTVKSVVQMRGRLGTLSDDEFDRALSEARQSLTARAESDSKGRPRALACAAEVIRRALGMTPYPVQLMGVLGLRMGLLSEMATGEGKTLVVAMAAVMAGWGHRTCHVITANDYLAQRDAAAMRAAFVRAGLVVSCALEAHSPEERRDAYAADVVYVTAKTLLADYLRDRIVAKRSVNPEWAQVRSWLTGAPPPEDLFILRRGLHTAIVDEADNILIDEAVTPLILSEERPAEGLSQAVSWAFDVMAELRAHEDYRLDERNRTLELLEGARTHAELQAWQLPAHWRAAVRREELVRQALVVRHFFRKGKQYLIDDGKVVLMDEFSGRLTPERSLNGGLHQAIERAEGVMVTPMKQSLEQMSFQGFFRRFKHLSGTTGTGLEARREFWRVYGLPVVRIPTHRPRRVRQAPPRFLRDDLDKWHEVAAEVGQLIQSGRAVLVGVRSVASSLMLSETLKERGIAHALLNAANAADEAEIVARAGRSGQVTVATNMAGRGTDIVLSSEVRAAGGLHVVIAECNESARIDRQLAGRCGRQGDPGSVRVMVSRQDPLLRRYASSRWFLGPAMSLVRRAQRLAEGDAFQSRLSVLRQDEWLRSALPFDGVRE